MKKQTIAVLLALTLIVSQSAAVFANEEKEAKATDEIDVIKEVEIKPALTLTLEQAYERMKKDSPQALTAKFNYDNEVQVGKGYTDSLREFNKAAKDSQAWIDTSKRPQMELRVKFAKVQADKNYEAEQNKLKRDVYDKYYNHKLVEAQAKIAKDNYDRALKLRNDVMLKYKVGKVSKLETISVENSLIEAEETYKKANNGLSTSKMAYNMFMGYNVKQEFTLTNILEPFPLPEMPLDEALKKALENRNELAAARHRAKMTRAMLKEVDDYPHSSITYKKAKIAYDLSMLALKNTPSLIEMDVRSKYTDMMKNLETVQNMKKTLDNTKEVAKLAQLRFDTGFITSADLKEMQAGIYNVEQAYYKAVLEYNLSVTDYYQCSTVGLTGAEI